MFGAPIASLSWTAVPSSHWSGPALWYAAIVLSLTSVVLGGQQAWLLPISISPHEAQIYRDKFEGKRQRALLAWQAPMMCLCYSILFFLAGLGVVVISPFARKGNWGEEAKVKSNFAVL